MLQRRVSQVYVEIPTPSRVSLSSYTSLGSKENQPLSPHAQKRATVGKDDVLRDKDASGLGSPSRKRKISQLDLPLDLAKKPKLDVPRNAQHANTEVFNCHQCSRKVPTGLAAPGLVHCTKLKKGVRCGAKFCKACLKNRYGENLDEILQKAPPTDPAARQGHAMNATYLYECHRCQGDCNCSQCRKARGLLPTGKISTLTGASAHEVLVQDPQAQSLIEKARQAKAMEVGSTLEGTSTAAPLKVVATARPLRKSKPTPEPVWREVVTDLSRAEVEDRIYLREFFLRFGPLVRLGQTHLDVLDDFTVLPDVTTKSLILAVLSLLGSDAGGDEEKSINVAMRGIRGAGMDLSKIWTILEELRGEVTFDFPDPVETEAIISYDTRHGGERAVQSAQFVPILIALCEIALGGASIRNDLEEMGKLAPQHNRDTLYGKIKIVNEKWSALKEKMKEAKEAASPDFDVLAWKAQYGEADKKYKNTIQKIEQEHYQSTHQYLRRFRQLGQDMDGRVYYVLSPRATKKLPSETERDEFKRWAWFVAAWGKPGANLAQHAEERGDDGVEHKWWGFSKPEDIIQLAKWIRHKGQLAHDEKEKEVTPSLDTSVGSSTTLPDTAMTTSATDLSDASDVKVLGAPKLDAEYYGPHPTLPEIKALTKGLEEFAEFLAWRIARETKAK